MEAIGVFDPILSSGKKLASTILRVIFPVKSAVILQGLPGCQDYHLIFCPNWRGHLSLGICRG